MVFKLCVSAVMVVIAPFWIFTLTTYNIFQDRLDNYHTIVVLGASVYNDRPSQVLQERLDTAVELYKKGNIKTIIVSGDNRDEYYNEPLVMKAYLQDKGVPEKVILEDKEGNRTIDSCYRAKYTFGEDRVILVTQAYHLARAAAVCRSYGVSVVPVVAPDPCISFWCTDIVREVQACWLAAFDIATGYTPQ